MFALVAPLIAIVWFTTIRAAVERYAEEQAAERTIVVNRAVDNLLQAAQNLAFERGRANVVLRQAGPVSGDNRAFLAARRQAVDGHLAEALAELADHPATQPLRAALPVLDGLRRRLDVAMELPAPAREPGLAETWYPAVSGVLEEVADLAGDVSLTNDRVSPTFRVLTRIKIQLLRLRNTLGMESSRIAALLAAGAPLDQAAESELAGLRGEAAAHWAMLRREVDLSGNAAIQAGLSQAHERFFTTFRPMQDSVLAAMRDGRRSPLTTQAYTEASVPALDAMPALLAVVATETRAKAEGRIAEARAALLGSLGLAFGALLLGAATLYVVVARLLIPLRTLRYELRALEAGNALADLRPARRHDELGDMQDAMVAFRDSLRERQRIAAALAEERERLSILIESMPDFVCFKDGAGRWRVVNPYGLALLGLEGADILGKTDAEVAELSPSWRNTLQGCDTDERAWAKAAPWRGEEVVVGADGAARFFDVVKVPLFHADGSRKGLVVVGRDLSERRRIEAALGRLSRQNELILECAGEGIIGVDIHGQAVFVNPAATRMTGWDIGDLLGHSHHDLVHHSHADGSPYPQPECPVYQTLTDGMPRLVPDDVFWKKDGAAIPVEFMVSPMVEQGQVRGAVLVFRDIGERKRAEAEIGQLLGELTRSNAELEQFAYAISHDLQEPLRMVSSYVQMLRRRYGGRLEPEADEFIDFAVDGAQRMSAMINALLEYARVNSRGQAPEPVDSGATLRQALDFLALAVEEAHARLTLPDAMPMVMGDFNQLVSVFQNLIGNALKYRHPDRTPCIDVTVEAAGPRWRFVVADNGIGIKGADAERVFGVFQRLRARPEVAGTGMGLAICKRIVERLGGSIGLEPNSGGGCRFVFTLPAVRG